MLGKTQVISLQSNVKRSLSLSLFSSPMISRPNALVVLFPIVVLLSHSHSKSVVSAGRSALHASDHRQEFALDLNASTFDAQLEDSPVRFAVVEFFANWCPSCRNYKPQYEKVASIFNGPDAVHPGLVVLVQVDCGLKINKKLCSRFSISRYPMLFWGSPSNFANGHWDPLHRNNEIKFIEDGRTSAHLLNWINKQLGSSFSLEDGKYENENTLPYNASDPELVARAIYDVEEATQKAFEIIIQHMKIKSETHTALIQFLQLLVAHHPSKRCRRGSSEILVNYDDVWPSDAIARSSPEPLISDKNVSLKASLICGKEVPRGYWIFCRGSKKDTRGFSCGLWILLHSLSVRVRDGEAHLSFTAICNFIHNFFICEECRLHFFEMCSSVTLPLNTTRDLSLWLWNAHNEVNIRLMKQEKSLRTGDSKFPKIIWPNKELCPSCHRTSQNISTIQVDWNKDEVFNFLSRYYGSLLVSSSYKNKTASVKSKESGAESDEVDDASTNAIPVGAALAIAVASCVFVALACFWRARQKTRKYFHHVSNLKMV